MKARPAFIALATILLMSACSTTSPAPVASNAGWKQDMRITLQTERVMLKEDPKIRTGVMSHEEATAAFKHASRTPGAKTERIHSDTALVRGGRVISGPANNQFPCHAFGETWIGTYRKVNLAPEKDGIGTRISYQHQVLVHPSGELSELRKPLQGKEQSATYLRASTVKEAVSFAGGKSLSAVRLRTAEYQGTIPYGSAVILKTGGNSTMTEYVLFTFACE